MDQDPRTTGPAVEPSDTPRSPDEIRADIAQTREEVGDTVEALAEKTDVKARTDERVAEVKANVKAHTPESGQDLVAKVRANPLPVLAAGALLAAFVIGRRSARP